MNSLLKLERFVLEKCVNLVNGNWFGWKWNRIHPMRCWVKILLDFSIHSFLY